MTCRQARAGRGSASRRVRCGARTGASSPALPSLPLSSPPFHFPSPLPPICLQVVVVNQVLACNATLGYEEIFNVQVSDHASAAVLHAVALEAAVGGRAAAQRPARPRCQPPAPHCTTSATPSLLPSALPHIPPCNTTGAQVQWAAGAQPAPPGRNGAGLHGTTDAL